MGVRGDGVGGQRLRATESLQLKREQAPLLQAQPAQPQPVILLQQWKSWSKGMLL